MSEERAAVLAEEREVLQSIYVDELEEIDEENLRIRVDPEEGLSGPAGQEGDALEPPTLALNIKYTQKYPEEAPEMSIECIGGSVPEQGIQEMQAELHTTAEESLGMAMVFALASQLKESLTAYIARTKQIAEAQEQDRRNAEIEAEAEKFRGTAVTAERFEAWRVTFEKEQKELKQKADEEYVRSTLKTAKEREEYRKLAARPTGKELFAKGGQMHDDKAEAEAEDVEGNEVDYSLYSREERERQRREEEERAEREARERLHDSDDE
ncbi:RWD-domain-containing protein [Ceraceosorus guamensis]|uniref:RWD-domain-containing protein n=1 Tax=Ceraceosorus guamensis TaxID=1522189 RepID=A0A316VY72_9BASI|nr:RWD-domain-containing protein [Ceraceosorus guamensis]PWN42274.1 RWD-domain-containing protein [Ceraceosorus guamensis]